MSMTGAPAELLKAGDAASALAALQAEVRAKPADSKLRVFLFQLLAVLGQWERALNQLKVCAEMEASALPMAQTYREAIRCELLRGKVFAGDTAPVVFGEPEQWIALLIESLAIGVRGEPTEAEELRARAFEEAPVTTGMLDGKPFVWIADADSRLGPVLEAIVNGKYYWIPFHRLAKVDFDEPEDLRDMVWFPARLRYSNGGESVALIPSRYAGSEAAADSAIALGRRTTWTEVSTGTFHGLGQRLLSTDQGDRALLDIRSIVLDGAVGS